MLTTSLVLQDFFPKEICELILRSLITEITDVKTVCYQDCKDCGEDGAFWTCGGGGDYIVCPQCNFNISVDKKENIIKTSDEWKSLFLCPDCSLIFNRCCTHGVNGCTFDVYYAKVVTGFRLDDFYFDGSPTFTSVSEIEIIANTCKLEFVIDCWSSINGKTFCSEASYKYNDKNSKYYHKHDETCSQSILKFDSSDRDNLISAICK